MLGKPGHGECREGTPGWRSQQTEVPRVCAPCILNLSADSQETAHTGAVSGRALHPPWAGRGRKAGTHREEVRELSLQEHLQVPLAELESVPFLARVPVEGSNHGVHGHLQLRGHAGSRTDGSRGRPPNSGTCSK